ncbi:MAG: Ppx/GppA phosphatase family protein [Nocardioides sp.]|uniref:Ppx/GppA phosphatase family protein n=1 Tax=Nocardioides sp. TaxID=35761 RepID=UPI0039E31C17
MRKAGLRPMIAAVDCGTNTIKMLIGQLPEIVVRESRAVRLGQGVDTSGELAEEALVRAFAALDEYAALIAQHPVERIRFCATSATRDASNAEVFAAGVRERLGVDPEVVSGDEEARLSFDGAVRNLVRDPEPPVLVIDIGGGSTELVLGRRGADGRSRVESAVSLDIGSVRLSERHLHSDPPSSAELAACAADADTALDGSPVDLALARTVVGVAGTIITVGAGVLDLPTYDPIRTDQAVVPVDGVHDYVRRLAQLTLAQRLALPYMHPGRADVIVGGALILDRVLRRTRTDSLVISEADILDGIAWSIADG